MPFIEEKIIRCVCNRCNPEYVWTPDRPVDPSDEATHPKRCPNCKSPYWNKARKERKKRIEP